MSGARDSYLESLSREDLIKIVKSKIEKEKRYEKELKYLRGFKNAVEKKFTEDLLFACKETFFLMRRAAEKVPVLSSIAEKKNINDHKRG
jgi:hypothetical protein